MPVGFGYETYEMYCRSARLSKKSSGIPAPVAGIIHAYGDGGKRLCDVNCSNGGGQTCYFQVSILTRFCCEVLNGFANVFL